MRPRFRESGESGGDEGGEEAGRVEDRAGAIDGAKVRVRGRAREGPRGGQRDGEGGDRPLSCPGGEDRGYGRWRRSGVPRTQSPRARGRRLVRRFIPGHGNRPGSAEEFEVGQLSVRSRPRGDVVIRTTGPGRGGQDGPQHQEREDRPEPGSRQEATSRESHPTPQVGPAIPPVEGRFGVSMGWKWKKCIDRIWIARERIMVSRHEQGASVLEYHSRSRSGHEEAACLVSGLRLGSRHRTIRIGNVCDVLHQRR